MICKCSITLFSVGDELPLTYNGEVIGKVLILDNGRVDIMCDKLEEEFVRAYRESLSFSLEVLNK